MKAIPKNLAYSVVIALVLQQLEMWTGANYLGGFLKGNLVAILLTLFAINIATLSIVLSKMRELLDAAGKGDKFSKSRSEMLFSVYEQAALVFVALVILVAMDAPSVKSSEKLAPIFIVGALACLAYGVRLLLDTSKAVFLILDFNQRKDD